MQCNAALHNLILYYQSLFAKVAYTIYTYNAIEQYTMHEETETQYDQKKQKTPLKRWKH